MNEQSMTEGQRKKEGVHTTTTKIERFLPCVHISKTTFSGSDNIYF